MEKLVTITTEERNSLNDIVAKGWHAGIGSTGDMRTLATIVKKILDKLEQSENTARKPHELNDA
jgi:hypothetical protein